jgi:hypothetical protein
VGSQDQKEPPTSYPRGWFPAVDRRKDAAEREQLLTQIGHFSNEQIAKAVEIIKSEQK